MMTRVEDQAPRTAMSLVLGALVILVAVPLLIIASTLVAFLSFDTAELLACPSWTTDCTLLQAWLNRTLMVLVGLLAVSAGMWLSRWRVAGPRGERVRRDLVRSIRWLGRAVIIAPLAVLVISCFAALFVHPLLCVTMLEMTSRVASCEDRSWGMILVVPIFMVFYGAVLSGALYLVRRFVLRQP